MSADNLLALLGIILAATWTPGPNNMMLAASGVTYGLRATLPHIFGVFIGFGLMIFTIALGLGEVFNRYPPLHQALRWGGAALLVWVAWKIATAKRPGTAGAATKPFTFVQAAAFQWVNPKAWITSISISRKLGVEIRMETAPDFDTFMQRTHEQRYDILFTAPHLYYLAHSRHNYRAVARVDRPGMQAIIVAPRTRNINSLEDLRDLRLATTDPLALATVLVRAQLEDAGIDPDKDLTLVPTPSHNASLLSTYQGVTDAAALIMPLFLRASPEIRESMVIVAKTRMVPHMPIAVATGIDDTMAGRISQALIELDDSAEGRSLLKHLAWPGFVPAREDEYATLGWITERIKVH